MVLRKIFTSSPSADTRGFTLIEVLVVLGLVSIIVGFTLAFDVNTYRGDAFRAERDVLIIALQTARADAMNNINEKKHGVAIHPDGYEGYVMFEGNTYATAEPDTYKEVPAIYGVELELASPTEVVFTQLSGDANFDGEIVLRDPNRNATTSIIINHEGKIGI